MLSKRVILYFHITKISSDYYRKKNNNYFYRARVIIMIFAKWHHWQQTLTRLAQELFPLWDYKNRHTKWPWRYESDDSLFSNPGIKQMFDTSNNLSIIIKKSMVCVRPNRQRSEDIHTAGGWVHPETGFPRFKI